MSAEVSVDHPLPAWKLPTRETQAQLVLAARSRRPGARTRLVESFMPLIGSVGPKCCTDSAQVRPPLEEESRPREGSCGTQSPAQALRRARRVRPTRPPNCLQIAPFQA